MHGFFRNFRDFRFFWIFSIFLIFRIFFDATVLDLPCRETCPGTSPLHPQDAATPPARPGRLTGGSKARAEASRPPARLRRLNISEIY